MMGATCPRCHRVHPSDLALTVGRFDTTGPARFRANPAYGFEAFPIRTKRAAAERDACDQWRHEHDRLVCVCGHDWTGHVWPGYADDPWKPACAHDECPCEAFVSSGAYRAD